MKISQRTMSRIIKKSLGLGAHQRNTSLSLTEGLRQIRATRAKKLLQQFAKNDYQQILFTDEKMFTVKEKFNRSNDRAHSPRDPAEKTQRGERGYHPALVTVWWRVTFEGVTQLHFCEQAGVKTQAINYQSDI